MTNINLNNGLARMQSNQAKQVQQKQEEVKNEAKDLRTGSAQEQVQAEYVEQGENLLDQMSMLASYNAPAVADNDQVTDDTAAETDETTESTDETTISGDETTESTNETTESENDTIIDTVISTDEPFEAIPHQEGNKIVIGDKSINIPKGFEPEIHEDGTVTLTKAEGDPKETRNYDANLDKDTVIKEYSDGLKKTYTYDNNVLASSLQEFPEGNSKKSVSTGYAADGKTKTYVETKYTNGEILTVKYSNGVISSRDVEGPKGTAHAEYDNGKIKYSTSTSADGTTVSIEYDENGNKTSGTKTLKSGDEDIKTSYEYQDGKIKTSVTVADNSTKTITYNPETGEKLSSINEENGIKKTYTYEGGKVTKLEKRDTVNNIKTVTEYDENGNVTVETRYKQGSEDEIDRKVVITYGEGETKKEITENGHTRISTYTTSVVDGQEVHRLVVVPGKDEENAGKTYDTYTYDAEQGKYVREGYARINDKCFAVKFPGVEKSITFSFPENADIKWKNDGDLAKIYDELKANASTMNATELKAKLKELVDQYCDIVVTVEGPISIKNEKEYLFQKISRQETLASYNIGELTENIKTETGLTIGPEGITTTTGEKIGYPEGFGAISIRIKEDGFIIHYAGIPSVIGEREVQFPGYFVHSNNGEYLGEMSVD